MVYSVPWYSYGFTSNGNNILTAGQTYGMGGFLTRPHRVPCTREEPAALDSLLWPRESNDEIG